MTEIPEWGGAEWGEWRERCRTEFEDAPEIGFMFGYEAAYIHDDEYRPPRVGIDDKGFTAAQLRLIADWLDSHDPRKALS